MTLRKDAAGVEAIWMHMQQRWADIQAKLFTNLGVFGVILGIMIRGMVSKAKVEEMKTFFADKDTVSNLKSPFPCQIFYGLEVKLFSLNRARDFWYEVQGYMKASRKCSTDLS
jgi:hypothetical protein